MSPDHSILLKYFPDLTEQQIERYKRLGELYKVWNSRGSVLAIWHTNLGVSVKDRQHNNHNCYDCMEYYFYHDKELVKGGN